MQSNYFSCNHFRKLFYCHVWTRRYIMTHFWDFIHNRKNYVVWSYVFDILWWTSYEIHEKNILCLCRNLFIVCSDLASGRDFHLTAERAEISDFEFYCIFERIWAQAEWSQARHLRHVTLGCVRWLLETGLLGGLQGRRSAPLGRGTAGEPCHRGALSSQVAWPGWRSCPKESAQRDVVGGL